MKSRVRDDNGRPMLAARDSRWPAWNERDMATQPPTLHDVLVDLGCSLFLDALRATGRMQRMRYVTVLVPNDGAFCSGTWEDFDESSWGVHVLDGAYKIGDLVNFNSGRMQPQSEARQHMLAFRMDIQGNLVTWVLGESAPPRKARIVKADVACRGGVTVHVVDRILYADF